MHNVFKGQFVKLLQCIYDDFRLKLDQVHFLLAMTGLNDWEALTERLLWIYFFLTS